VHAQVFHRERDARSAARKRALKRSAASIIHPPRINSDAVTLIGAPSLILLRARVVGNLLPVAVELRQPAFPVALRAHVSPRETVR